MHAVVVGQGLDYGGSVIALTHRQAEYLAEQGDRVTLVSDRCPPDLNGVNCVEVQSLGSRVSRRLDFELVRWVRRIPSSKWRSLLRTKDVVPQLLFPRKAARRIEQIHRESPIDCIFTQQCIVPPPLLRFQASNGVPLVVIPQADIFHPSWWESLGIPLTLYYHHGTKVSFRHASRVLAVSRQLARSAIACGARPDRVSVIPNGVDISEIGPIRAANSSLQRKAKCELLYVGRLFHYKDVDTLLDALSLVKEESWFCRLVGGGPLEDHLRAKAAKLGISGKCEFAGSLPRCNLRPYYELADCFVLPSLTEGLPFVLAEATTCGLPVVCTHVGGNPDIVENGKTGLVVPPREPHALAEAIDHICADDELRRRMGEEAERVSKRFALSHVLKAFREALKAVVEETGASRKPHQTGSGSKEET